MHIHTKTVFYRANLRKAALDLAYWLNTFTRQKGAFIRSRYKAAACLDHLRMLWQHVQGLRRVVIGARAALATVTAQLLADEAAAAAFMRRRAAYGAAVRYVAASASCLAVVTALAAARAGGAA